MKTSTAETVSTTPSSIHQLDRRYSRPKSTPANRFRVTYADKSSQPRPKTASLTYQNCERLGAVEREGVRQHKLQPHLPARRDKPSPWQAQLEGTQKPVHIAPGYILSRSKSKYQIVIHDKLFEMQKAKAKQNQEQGILEPEIEQMINNLKEQVSDLSLHLEEERLSHRDTKRKSEEYLQDRVDEMKRDHKEAMRRLTDEHEELMEKTLTTHEQEVEEQKDSFEAIIAKHSTEMAFLQGAFESYKSQNDVEHQQALDELRVRLDMSSRENLQSQIQDLGRKMSNEKAAALAAMTREHKKTIATLEKQSNKELETLNRRFANHAADIRKLKETESEKADLTEKYDNVCLKVQGIEKELANVKRDRAEFRAKLSVFERDFEARVEEVDNRYRTQIAELMEQNTELRKQYMKKCDQLFSLTAKIERENTDQLISSKQAMKALIESRSNAYVSVAANDPNIKRSIPKERPCSAPSTSKEVYLASASAGETDEVLARREVPFVRPQSVLEVSAVFATKELEVLTDEELAAGLIAPPEY